MGLIAETYIYLFKDLADPRVYDWPFMGSPFPMLGVIFLYLYSVYVFLPSFMANRKPYNLSVVLIVYNLFQIILCLTMFYGLATSGWTIHYTLGCELVDYSNEGMPLRMAYYMWVVTMSKFLDMIDTILFSLRKKYNQVSTFHVFHHTSTVVIIWILTKYCPGGMATFGALLNSAVHVLMYTYYLLACLGPQMQKRLERIKPKLTLIQIAHIVLIIIHHLQLLLPSCQFPKVLIFTTLLPAFINLYFFTQFSIKNYYIKKERTKLQ